MADEPIRNDRTTLQQSIHERITALLDQYVQDGILIEYDHSTVGHWTTLARYGEIRRSVFMDIRELMAYLDGLASAKAFSKALEEIDDIRSRLGYLVVRGVLTFVAGFPPADNWIIAGPNVEKTELNSRAEACEFLEKYEQ